MVAHRPTCAFPVLIALCLLALTRPVGAQQETPVTPPPPPVPLERVQIENVAFSGNTALSDQILRDAAGISPGTTVNPTILTEAIKHIEAAYADRGYIAEVTQVRIIGTEPPRTVQFDIRETVVSDIIVQGLHRTSETALRRLMDLKPGQLFNRRVLQSDIDRLNNLGVFEDIAVQLEPGDEPGQVIVVYNLTERKTGEITFGGSFSPEGRLVGEATYTEANLFGRAQRLSATATVGSISGRLGGQIAYYNPLIATPRTDLLVRAYSDVYYRFSRDLVDEPDTTRYFERRTGFESTAGRRLDQYRRASLGFRYNNVTTEGLPFQFFTIPEAGTGGTVLMPNARYIDDHRLYLVLPSSGNYLNAFLEAGSASRGDASGGVAKLTAERSWYVPLQAITPEMLAAERPRPVRTLAIRFSGATSVGKLPFFEQFFLGGVYNLRGYREQRFWGKNLVLLNTEFRQPFGRNLVGVAFVDVGDAWGSDFQFVPGTNTPFMQHENFSPRAGAGVGVLWLTSFGTLRFDIAKGEETRLHFAFGEAF